MKHQFEKWKNGWSQCKVCGRVDLDAMLPLVMKNSECPTK